MVDSTSTEKESRSESPPDDDCCPICFGSFTVPCRSNCGHWFCGSCILQFWNYSSASNPCKCPMCSCSIVSLMPKNREEQSDDEVLKSVRRYNLLFCGGARGFLQKLIDSPLFIKRFFCRMMDPDTNRSYIAEMRLFAMIMSALYTATPFDFLPTGSLGTIRLFDYGAIALVLILRLVGIYRRRRLAQRVRHLAVEISEE